MPSTQHPVQGTPATSTYSPITTYVRYLLLDLSTTHGPLALIEVLNEIEEAKASPPPKDPRGRQEHYPWSTMAVDTAFEVLYEHPAEGLTVDQCYCAEDRHALRNRLSASAAYQRQRHNRRFTVNQIPGGFRVTRAT